MTLDVLDLPALRRWVVIARADLARHAEAINRLNVFPVPDGDTGTNMLLTLDEAAREVSALRLDGLGESVAALSRAALMSARGNSGVILSQLVRGIGEVALECGREHLEAVEVAAALRRAGDLARAGVTRPVEGTVLSVAAAAGQAATGAVTLHDVAEAALEAGRAALLATRDQLDVLREAGVVDAGGAGYLVVLEALHRVVADSPDPEHETPEWLSVAPRAAVTGPDADCDPAVEGPAYEVMYLLDDSDDARVERLKQRLDPLGDSLVVAGGPQVWSVHVHVDDVAAALNAGAAAGRPHRFAVTRFDAPVATPTRPAPGFGVLVLTDGLSAIPGVRDAGAAVIEMTTVRDRPGVVVDLLRDSAGEQGTLVLTDSDAAAEVVHQAAEIAGGVVQVVGSHPVHVLAGLSVLDTSAGLDAAAAAAREVAGDVTTLLLPQLGPEATTQVLDTVRDVGGEVVTLVTGAGHDVPAELSNGLAEAGPEVSVLHSSAARWALAVGVE
ncbi:DAK2 domain-containing protein [Luteipulveratus halotolerans]|uniref:DAK2 domain-containing protein n=1 Tax=Luteipulveratus halotolerans TaxID=1631356 RepID=UPI0006802C1E|nr:DAK2 domain-containing protein [Luteipulveratus halotolerans]